MPCRITFAGDANNKAVLKQVHQHNIASMAWQHASLRSLQRRLGVSSLWDSIFVFQPRQESLEHESAPLWTFDAGDAEEISVQVRWLHDRSMLDAHRIPVPSQPRVA